MKKVYELAQAINQFDSEIGISYHYFISGETKHEKHFHDFCEVLIVLEGKMLHHVNEKSFIVTRGDMIFLRPHDHHYMEKIDDITCRAINIPFSDNTLLQVLRFIKFIEFSHILFESISPPKVKLNEDEIVAVANTFHNLDFLENLNEKVFTAQLLNTLSTLVSNFFLDVYVKSSIPDWFTYLCEEMHKKDNFTAGVSQMMNITDKSYQHIGRTFKKFLGKTPTQFINHLRLRHGVSLIISTNLPITDIIYECGFNNPSQFFQLFKEQYNYTPKELKKDISKFMSP